jgi:glycine/D-amino acid oxidase-like deaminating enzyme
MSPRRGASGRTPTTRAPRRYDTVVVGAGVFGAWTAWFLRRRRRRVLLLDASGPANARASSGGESRMTRTIYGADEIYARMARDSLVDWRWLSDRAGLPIYRRLGVLFFGGREAHVDQTIEIHRRLRLPLQVLDRSELGERFPQFSWDGIEVGVYEPDFGALMARRAVQTLVKLYAEAGGEYRQALVLPPAAAGTLRAVDLSTGEQVRASSFVFACGPWLPRLFPELLGSRIFPTRQEVFFFAPEPGDTRFLPGRLPAWADYSAGDLYYGFPDLEARGFKIAHDRHGPAFDPERGDRSTSAEGLADVRAYVSRRFPALSASPLVESRVCQYENSSNGDFLIDRHPTTRNIWLVGAGSGHGFKHGPAVGRCAADLVTGRLHTAEARFSLASKATEQARTVH